MMTWLLRTPDQRDEHGEIGTRRPVPPTINGRPAMRRRRGRAAVAAVAASALGLLLSAAASQAHDFWLDPGSFTPAQSPVTISLRVGDTFPGEPFPRDPTHLERFVVAGPRGVATVGGRPGWDPAGYAPLTGAGVHVVGYLSTRQRIVAAGTVFDGYVTKEALGDVIVTRAAVKAPEAPVRELFTRCAKSLVSFGDPRAGGGDVALGLPLELVAETNPYTAAPGQTIVVRLLHRGEPLAGATVSARNPARPDMRLVQRTDSDGRAAFRLPQGGFWLVRAIHMLPSSRDSGADWESLWASLTFAVSSGNPSE